MDALNDCQRKSDTCSGTPIDVLEQDILDASPFLLDLLLQDKTTGKNIVWATDDYVANGSAYAPEKEILPARITGTNTKIIQPRIAKNKEAQRNRTRKSAEVFTPSWICCLMNNFCDAEWFGRENVFNTMDGHDWTPTKQAIAFKPDGRKTPPWMRYVDSRRLEITCGEAPYLVSRYDATTGESLPVEKRIGVLDRKLRVVSENTANETDWFFWARRAFESTYGYEYQGDNLLLARENLLCAFADYHVAKFGKPAPLTLLKQIANIIAWNVWQMDGLKDCVPFGDSADFFQFDLFGNNDFSATPPCKIRDWRGQKTIKFTDLKGTKAMKFDFVIGNPPYQEETAVKETNNGQKRRKSIFQYFQITADKISNKGSALIYPAVRWIHRSGKGMEEFGLNQINDVHLKKLIVYANAREAFTTTDIGDGVSIVIKDMNKKIGGFDYIYNCDGKKFETHQNNPQTKLMPLCPADADINDKITNFVKANNFSYLCDAILPRNLFGIESDFVEKNPNKAIRFSDENTIDFTSKIKLLTNDKAGKAGRATWFITDKNTVSRQDLINEWQVVVSSANAGGQKRDNQMEIIDNHSAFGRSRVALKSFKTEEEAKNFYKYAKSYIIRYAFLMTDENLTSLAKRVPDIADYRSNNGLIDFSKDVDQQICCLMNITPDEYQYIENRVDTFRKGAKE